MQKPSLAASQWEVVSMDQPPWTPMKSKKKKRVEILKGSTSHLDPCLSAALFLCERVWIINLAKIKTKKKTPLLHPGLLLTWIMEEEAQLQAFDESNTWPWWMAGGLFLSPVQPPSMSAILHPKNQNTCPNRSTIYHRKCNFLSPLLRHLLFNFWGGICFYLPVLVYFLGFFFVVVSSLEDLWSHKQVCHDFCQRWDLTQRLRLNFDLKSSWRLHV